MKISIGQIIRLNREHAENVLNQFTQNQIASAFVRCKIITPDNVYMFFNKYEIVSFLTRRLNDYRTLEFWENNDPDNIFIN